MTDRPEPMKHAPPAGLCERCRHARAVETPRSLFLLCERSATDSRYARYPRLPVRECGGFEERTADAPGR